MAELKLIDAKVNLRLSRRFHGVTTVAELKLVLLGDVQPEILGFHGVTTVAELKPAHNSEVRLNAGVSTVSQPWPN